MSCSHVDVRIAEKILRLRIELARLRRENKALRCFCKLENGQKMEFCGVDIDEAMHRVLMYPAIEFHSRREPCLKKSQIHIKQGVNVKILKLSFRKALQTNLWRCL